MTPLTALITGLTIGGLTCLAVQGGLLLGVLARRGDEPAAERKWVRLLAPVGAFLVAKIIAYTLLGFALGLLGAKLQLSLTARLWLQVGAGVFMILTGVRLFVPRWLPWLDLHPPARVRRLVRQSTRTRTWLAPALLGLLTILIPCGTTQAMELAAISASSAIEAAIILFVFTLGTAPLFVVIGVLARGTAMLQRRLTAAAAIVVIALGMYSVNGALIATDSSYSFQSIVAAAANAIGRGEQTTVGVDGQVTIAVSATGYAPSRVSVPAGKEVKIALEREGALGCTSLFLIPRLSISADLSRGNRVVTTTFPERGAYRFTCGMGMYSGIIDAA